MVPLPPQQVLELKVRAYHSTAYLSTWAASTAW
eukprot:CAMPEP_0172623958 /NCGR_PEP_ID=MMETSP1068-20121228/132877_1 /TAXON_ID=35684 /ORGANISM="Pseudopedinella elastica, Strain CCMP716" /LENGTH=32 /DNA_ID= /DNA_START= /DNA_END= /DNA_ORIENTATION=